MTQTKLISRGEHLDWWECECGNMPDTDGFYACDANGRPQHSDFGDPEDVWSGEHYYCYRCGMVASNITGDTVRPGSHSTIARVHA